MRNRFVDVKSNKNPEMRNRFVENNILKILQEFDICT